MKKISDYLNEISNIDHNNCRDFKECRSIDEYVIEKLKHLIIADFKNEVKNAPTQEGE